MRVAFIVPSLEPSGGVHTATQHARLLRRRAGMETALVVTRPDKAAADSQRGVPVLDSAQAAASEWDVVIWTWWTTWRWAMEVPARKRVLLLQGLDERFYPWSEPLDRLGASMAFAEAEAIIVISEHLREIATTLRPEVPCVLVRNGLDREIFAPDPLATDATEDRPLRILVEGQPGLRLKGVDDALAAARAMREPAHVTLVALNPRDAEDVSVDRLVGGLDPPAMADLYRSSDVLLKLSRTEGLGLPPLEAAAVGVPSVVTPYGGHADWVRHGINGVEVGFDDRPGTAAWLDALARDRDLLRRLGRGALETARAWPTVDEATDQMASALSEFVDGVAHPSAGTRQTAARTLARNIEIGRQSNARVTNSLAASQAAHETMRNSLEYRVWMRLRGVREHVRSLLSSHMPPLGRRKRSDV